MLTTNFDPTPQFTYARNNNGGLFNSNMITTGPVNTLNPTPDTLPTTTTATTGQTTTAAARGSNTGKQSTHSTHSRPHHTTHTRAHSYSAYKSGANIPTTSVANYQPYPGLISRANLVIVGDLETMLTNWQPEEINQKRRLVQFHRSQIGQDIQCSFKPILPSEYMASNNNHDNEDMDTATSTFDDEDDDDHHLHQDSNDSSSILNDHPMNQLKLYQQQKPHDTIVSCIYWNERDDFFITSVDCIHLLEKLMNIRFSVEEKNRVRRNLEGFRPLTVSKCKAESANFFKLIMSFPHPKPRNIEKDVKVFPWKTLPYALKKIITKYTASTYSTAAHDNSSTTSSSSSTSTTNRFSSPTASSQQQQQRYQRRASAPPKHFDVLRDMNVNPIYQFSSPSSSNNNTNTNPQGRPLSTPDALSTFQLHRPLQQMDDPHFGLPGLIDQHNPIGTVTIPTTTTAPTSVTALTTNMDDNTNEYQKIENH